MQSSTDVQSGSCSPVDKTTGYFGLMLFSNDYAVSAPNVGQTFWQIHTAHFPQSAENPICLFVLAAPSLKFYLSKSCFQKCFLCLHLNWQCHVFSQTSFLFPQCCFRRCLNYYLSLSIPCLYCIWFHCQSSLLLATEFTLFARVWSSSKLVAGRVNSFVNGEITIMSFVLHQ